MKTERRPPAGEISRPTPALAEPADGVALTEQARLAAAEVAGHLRPGQILVVGCSTSEVVGQRIGTAGSAAVALELLDGLLAGASGLHLAVQCCEHLNRALVVERAVAEAFGLEEVTVVPVANAGGALAAAAYSQFTEPVVVESVRAHGGLDIGETLIGMHLRRVAVPLRLVQNRIGEARVVGAWARPPLIGGSRACYSK